MMYDVRQQPPDRLPVTALPCSPSFQHTPLFCIAGLQNWQATVSEQTYLEYFTQQRDKLVYLTADSTNVISDLEADKVYIIGGLVDRNRHKNMCMNRATSQGLATAALPISQHVEMEASGVITVNQVVQILLDYSSKGDWASVLRQVVPQRKTKRDDAADKTPAN